VMDEHGKARVPTAAVGGKTVALAPERPKNAETMRGLVAGCGLAPLVAVEQADKANLPIETILYRNGAAEFYSLQTDVLEWKQSKPQATITFPHEGYLYDVREGKALGRGDKAQATLDPMHILLYALLPYEVRGVQVTALPARVGQGLPVKLTVQTGPGQVGTHYLRVTATGPEGKERPGFARTVEAKQGVGETKLWLALSDAPGKWTVQARDAATGVTGSAVVEVRP
jgi:hypothetical protein